MTRKGILSSTIGQLSAIGLSLGCILIFALIANFCSVPQVVVKVINQIIKIGSVFLGTAICVRESGGVWKGALFGLVYSILTFAIFGLIANNLVFDMSFVIDVTFGTIIGALCGVISVNLRK